MHLDEAILGTGSVSLAIEKAIVIQIDFAINYGPTTIDNHEMNYPNTKHYFESTLGVDCQ